MSGFPVVAGSSAFERDTFQFVAALGSARLENRFAPADDGWHYGEVRRIDYDEHGKIIKFGAWRRTGVRISFGD